MAYVIKVKDSINSRLTDVIGYLKAPVSAGGVGDTNHLYEISYLGIPDVVTSDYISTADYYSVLGNSKMDLCGISSYFNNQSMMKDRRDYQVFVRDNLSSKPLHAAEGSSFGAILLPDTTWHNTATFYNNYDVTFHNELWATAFMGGFTTLNTWLGEVVHRWKYATKDSLGWAFPMLVHDSVSPFSTIQIYDTINSYYHNFKRLSEFTTLIDFNQNYVPCIYYGDSVNNIESYYLKSTDTSKVYGWFHNINKYWGNSYYYKIGNDIYENFFGCDTLPQPDTLFQLPGFKQNCTYYIYYFWTRLGGAISTTK